MKDTRQQRFHLPRVTPFLTPGPPVAPRLTPLVLLLPLTERTSVRGAALRGGSPASRLRPAGPAAPAAPCVAQERPPEALGSKVSLKLSPGYRSSSLSGPVSACFQAASVLAGRGRAGEGSGRPLVTCTPSKDTAASDHQPVRGVNTEEKSRREPHTWPTVTHAQAAAPRGGSAAWTGAPRPPCRALRQRACDGGGRVR